MSTRTPTEAFACAIEQDLIDIRDSLIERELVSDHREIIKTEYARDCFEIAWNSTSRLSLGYVLKSEPRFRKAHTIAHYVALLRNRDYFLRLLDGSLIQVAYKVEEGSVVWHRLCWFPCPFAFTQEECGEMANGDLSALLDVLGLNEVQLTTPVRFDFDVKFSDEVHAHSHLTFNRADCRVPVFGPLSVAHFFRFTLNYFCSDFAANIEPIHGLRAYLYQRTLPKPYSHELFIDTSVSNSYR